MTEGILSMGVTFRLTDRATGYCLVPYPPNRALGFLSRILRENGVRLSAPPEDEDRLVGRIGRAWAGSRVSVEVYPHSGSSFVEITAESRGKGGGVSSAIVQRLAHAAGGRSALPPGGRGPAADAAPVKLNAKVCLVGESAVGKTSLVRRFVLDVYGDAYIKTIGTKVTRREVVIFPPDGPAVNVNLVIWDIMADAGFRDVLQDAYFAGARGLLAVADITRRPTLADLVPWIDSARGLAGRSIPAVIVGNKSDLAARAELGPGDLQAFAGGFGYTWVSTSAKTGENVEGAFRRLAVSIASDSTRGPVRPAEAPGEPEP